MTEETRPGLSDMMQSGAATLMPDILAAKAPDLTWTDLSDEIEAEKAAILADGICATRQDRTAKSCGPVGLHARHVPHPPVADRRPFGRHRHLPSRRDHRLQIGRDGAAAFQDQPRPAGGRVRTDRGEFLQGGQEVFGEKFKYTQETLNDDFNSVMIQRCFFNDFLRGNQAPELIPVFCARDNIWADEIKTEKYGVTFQRASLLFLGDDACRFQFKRREGGKSRS